MHFLWYDLLVRAGNNIHLLANAALEFGFCPHAKKIWPSLNLGRLEGSGLFIEFNWIICPTFEFKRALL